MKRLPPGPQTVKGLDVSHYDAQIDFNRVKASGRQFAIAKCTEFRADNTYATNRLNAKAAGMIWGAYHFFHPSRDPAAQAHQFIQLAKLGPGDLPAMLDWEASDGMPSKSDRARGQIWLDVVEQATGKPPMIYAGPYFLNALGLETSFKKYPLVVAHYGTPAPLVPAPWDHWTFWQYTSKGDVPGIPAADEDLDMFNGSLDDLKKILL